MKFDHLVDVSFQPILSLTENSILSNWGKQWHGWNKTLLSRTLKMIWEMVLYLAIWQC